MLAKDDEENLSCKDISEEHPHEASKEALSWNEVAKQERDKSHENYFKDNNSLGPTSIKQLEVKLGRTLPNHAQNSISSPTEKAPANFMETRPNVTRNPTAGNTTTRNPQNVTAKLKIASSSSNYGMSATGSPAGNPYIANHVIPIANTSSSSGVNATGNSTGHPYVANDKKFLPDCYSFLALHGPWKTSKRRYFFFGLLPFIFQMTFFVLLLWSALDRKRGTIGDTDNPDDGLVAQIIPSNASPIVRCTQLVSIAYYVIFHDSSLKDVVKAVQMFPRSSEVQVGDPVGCMRFSCVLRGLQGILAMFAVLTLVISADRVVDIILNIAAVNFISYLDETTFSSALSGDFGPALKTEAEKIINKDLPACMYKASKHIYYMLVSGIVFLVLFGIMIYMVVGQNSSKKWITNHLRVQFQEATGLKDYSGCFELNTGPSSVLSSRRFYHSFENGTSNSSFGYCRKDRQWVLVKGNINITTDICDVKKNGDELARSSKTDTFDISTSFDESWVSSTNTPLDMYFFESGELEELHCNSFLGDGKCDIDLNKLGYDFDGGDCCAATCTQSNCGRNQSVFGNSTFAEVAFPYCKDGEMLPITIQLNDVKNSRNDDYSLIKNFSLVNGIETSLVFERFSLDENEWIMESPASPYFSLECDNKIVLTVYVNQSMINKSETVMVKDGANCTLTTSSKDTYDPNPKEMDAYNDEDMLQKLNEIPIWHIDYTIFHGENSGDKEIEILTQKSWEKDTAFFKRIPECYFTKLGNYTDIATMYRDIGPSNEAIDWLVEVDKDNTLCESEDMFDQRYAVSKLFFAMKETKQFVQKQPICTWPSITCVQGEVFAIQLQENEIVGEFASEISLVKNLKELFLGRNNLTKIPSEIVQLSKLQTLKLDDNELTSVTSEIGQLSSLQTLWLHDNKLLSVPSEIGQLSSLQTLYLYDNKLLSVPSEIGQLSSLLSLYLYDNKLLSVPSELGQLSSLLSLYLHDNKLLSVPSELGQLSSLLSLNLHSNKLTSVPSEIGQLSSLQTLYLGYNKLLSVPREIGQLSSLQTLSLNSNELTSVPSEIGQLSSLQKLWLDDNKLLSVPSELGQLSSLLSLNLPNNQLTSVPSEIGQLSSLQKLWLDSNELTSVPSEICRLSSLQTLGLCEYDY